MDSKSVELGDNVMRDLPNFNYYKRDGKQQTKSSSITTVNDPIVATGTPLFVYEIPRMAKFFRSILGIL